MTLREIYDMMDFKDVDSFEEFAAMFYGEMNKVKSVSEMIEERQLGGPENVKKVREIEKQNAMDGIHYAEPGEDPEAWEEDDEN